MLFSLWHKIPPGLSSAAKKWKLHSRYFYRLTFKTMYSYRHNSHWIPMHNFAKLLNACAISQASIFIACRCCYKIINNKLCQNPLLISCSIQALNISFSLSFEGTREREERTWSEWKLWSSLERQIGWVAVWVFFSFFLSLHSYVILSVNSLRFRVIFTHFYIN